MTKLDEDDLILLEKYAKNLRKDIDEFTKYSRMIKFTEEQQLINDAAIEILERKYKEMVEAKNYKKLNKIIRIKKIVGDTNGEE